MKEEVTLASEINPWIISTYICYSGLLVAKMLFSVCLVAFARTRTRIVSNPEDLPYVLDRKEGKVGASHPFLDRVLRMHAHDLENIIPFMIIGLLYTMTHDEGYWYAVLHYRVFLAARLLTSFCHFFALQPWRTVCHLVGMVTSLSMLSSIFIKAGATLQYF